jgi:hypothetical protein
MASPLKILIGLHYWTTPTPYAEHEPDHASSPAVQEAVQDFIKGGLLVERSVPSEYGSKYEATDALRVWVEALCNVRWPVQVWVVPTCRSAEQLHDAQQDAAK